eukprot:scaffold9547_cov102-Isochrysis_galbana.AAC.1
MESRVVFPAPDGPSTASTRPAPTQADTCLSSSFRRRRPEAHGGRHVGKPGGRRGGESEPAGVRLPCDLPARDTPSWYDRSTKASSNGVLKARSRSRLGRSGDRSGRAAPCEAPCEAPFCEAVSKATCESSCEPPRESTSEAPSESSTSLSASVPSVASLPEPDSPPLPPTARPGDGLEPTRRKPVLYPSTRLKDASAVPVR